MYIHYVYICICLMYTYVCISICQDREWRKERRKEEKKGRKCDKLLRIDDLRWKVVCIYLFYISSNFNVN